MTTRDGLSWPDALAGGETGLSLSSSVSQAIQVFFSLCQALKPDLLYGGSSSKEIPQGAPQIVFCFLASGEVGLISNKTHEDILFAALL